jgi:hypothetical protein
MSINCPFVVVLGSDSRVCDNRIVVTRTQHQTVDKRTGFTFLKNRVGGGGGVAISRLHAKFWDRAAKISATSH